MLQRTNFILRRSASMSLLGLSLLGLSGCAFEGFTVVSVPVERHVIVESGPAYCGPAYEPVYGYSSDEYYYAPGYAAVVVESRRDYPGEWHHDRYSHGGFVGGSSHRYDGHYAGDRHPDERAKAAVDKPSPRDNKPAAIKPVQNFPNTHPATASERAKAQGPQAPTPAPRSPGVSHSWKAVPGPQGKPVTPDKDHP